ncbi:hypothetical protein [Janthinobacterium sp. YR213]|uniref:hypothetical protein n=1 Tax=Janthinobacterium sp. YR213 TaxID=1881027 RepID=UPI0008915F38|nr:hypothetical protein [Janthinobacterium sp. YR213]SDH46173.1 hypothetical protein SAMN05428968_3532 [Janthinobacterium sp. YR213]
MSLFNSFFSQEWVKITTVFLYVALIIVIPFIYIKLSKNLDEQSREKFVDNCWEFYGVLFFLSIAPVGYLILYFLNSDTSFIDKDPLPWVCFLGGAGALFDYIRTRRQLKLAIKKNRTANRVSIVNNISRMSRVTVVLSAIPLTYGAIMVGLTNSSYLAKLPAIMWFFSFLISGLAIICAVWAKAILSVSQAYASNPDLAANPYNKGIN